MSRWSLPDLTAFAPAYRVRGASPMARVKQNRDSIGKRSLRRQELPADGFDGRLHLRADAFRRLVGVIGDVFAC